MKVLAICLNLFSLALAASRKTAPPGALTVGAGQKFTTISSAVAALSNTTTSEQVIFIHPGIYAEQVYIPKLSGPLTVFGYTRDDTKYSRNEVTIVASQSQKTQPNNDLTATLRVWTIDFKLYNVNVKNAFGPGSQAVAVSAQAGVSPPSSHHLRTKPWMPKRKPKWFTDVSSLLATRLLRLLPDRLPRHTPCTIRRPTLR